MEEREKRRQAEKEANEKAELEKKSLENGVDKENKTSEIETEGSNKRSARSRSIELNGSRSKRDEKEVNKNK